MDVVGASFGGWSTHVVQCILVFSCLVVYLLKKLSENKELYIKDSRYIHDRENLKYENDKTTRVRKEFFHSKNLKL